jgi:hypothetical protein
VNSAPFIVIGHTYNTSDVRAVPPDYVQVLGQTQMWYKDE